MHFDDVTLANIMQGIFVATALGFIRVLLFLGKTVKENNEKAISAQTELVHSVTTAMERALEKIGERLDKIETALSAMTTAVRADISQHDKRISLIEHDMKYVMPRRESDRHIQERHDDYNTAKHNPFVSEE